MSSSSKFIKQSLSLHLFFARIMKEHSLFLEAGFTPRDANFAQQAGNFRKEFDQILNDAIVLSNGVACDCIIQSGEIVTPYTLNAEKATSYYTGVQIPIQLTQAEQRLVSGDITPYPMLEQQVSNLNQRTISATAALAQFKREIHSNVLSCHMFTFNYPSLLEHIVHEAELYLDQLRKIQNGNRIDTTKNIRELELFWGRQMVEHVEFIRGMLDPTENTLIDQANQLIDEYNDVTKGFDQLLADAKTAINTTMPLDKASNEKLKVARDIQNFKTQGTQGILACEIKSIIVPLLADHTLREANHYLRILKMS